MISFKAILIIFIIGLVVGAFHSEANKGRDLIENAKITFAAKTLEAVNNASYLFNQKYKYFPGDLPNPGKRLPECQKYGCASGNGNSVIDETVNFWPQLLASNLLTENTSLDEGYVMPFYFSEREKGLPFVNPQYVTDKGHYLVLSKDKVVDEKSYFLLSQQAARIDRKIDDGVPYSGRIIAATKGKCIKTDDAGKIAYNEKYKKPCAFLYFKMRPPEEKKKS